MKLNLESSRNVFRDLRVFETNIQASTTNGFNKVMENSRDSILNALACNFLCNFTEEFMSRKTLDCTEISTDKTALPSLCRTSDQRAAPYSHDANS